jgi:outer membrane protein assembly factor BamD (BamD/ComL family)
MNGIVFYSLQAICLLLLVATHACSTAQDVQSPENLNKEAQGYYNQGKYAEAETLFKRALALRENSLGPEHPEVATILNNSPGERCQYCKRIRARSIPW